MCQKSKSKIKDDIAHHIAAIITNISELSKDNNDVIIEAKCKFAHAKVKIMSAMNEDYKCSSSLGLYRACNLIEEGIELLNKGEKIECKVGDKISNFAMSKKV